MLTNDLKPIVTDARTLEIWNAGGGDSYLYTEDKMLVKELRRKLGTYATYHRNEGTFAWQFKIRTRLIPAVLKRAMIAIGYEHRKIQPLINNDLADPNSWNLLQDAHSSSTLTHNTPDAQPATPAASAFNAPSDTVKAEV